ncbi:hypothetical protein DRO57_00145 [Candidatus Bathyarchaeota archaeon]|nr:MAG: hypothetical protein DRO57_00145 [Candidatus Bathyarchaeota archaeon]
MKTYSTISVPVEVKRILEKAKGDEDWGSFLLKLYRKAELHSRKEAFKELSKLLTEHELESITRSSKEFRERFKLR